MVKIRRHENKKTNHAFHKIQDQTLAITNFKWVLKFDPPFIVIHLLFCHSHLILMQSMMRPLNPLTLQITLMCVNVFLHFNYYNLTLLAIIRNKIYCQLVKILKTIIRIIENRGTFGLKLKIMSILPHKLFFQNIYKYSLTKISICD